MGPGPVFAQSLAEYGGTASVATTVSRAWSDLTYWVGALPPVFWYVVIGGLVLALVLRRVR